MLAPEPQEGMGHFPALMTLPGQWVRPTPHPRFTPIVVRGLPIQKAENKRLPLRGVFFPCRGGAHYSEKSVVQNNLEVI